VATELGAPLYCPRTPKDPEFLQTMQDLKPDVIIVCGYQFYIPETLLNIPPQGVINFHTSLLPRHCGRHPGWQTIWYGDKETGMTVHYMDKGLDTGDIIYQNKIPVLPGDTVDSLYQRIWDACEPLVKQLLDDLDNNSVPREPQDPALYFYNYEIDECDWELDFRQPAEILKNRVDMMPGKFFFNYQDRKYYIKECSLAKESLFTRNFRLRVPCIFEGKLTFVTPRMFLQIDKIVIDGRDEDPLSVINADTLKTIKSK
jgi:methionyl-tRNA formyltransferase